MTARSVLADVPNESSSQGWVVLAVIVAIVLAVAVILVLVNRRKR